MPRSCASRSAPSSPCARQTASRLAVLPPADVDRVLARPRTPGCPRPAGRTGSGGWSRRPGRTRRGSARRSRRRRRWPSATKQIRGRSAPRRSRASAQDVLVERRPDAIRRRSRHRPSPRSSAASPEVYGCRRDRPDLPRAGRQPGRPGRDPRLGGRGPWIGLPGVRVRAVSPLYATAPWGVTDQPEFRNAVVAVDVDARAARPAGGAQGPRARGRSTGRSSLGSAGAGHRPARLRPTACPRGAAAARPARSTPPTTRRRPLDSWRSRIATSGSGCSCSRPWPTWRRGSSRPAGTRPWRRGAAAVAARRHRTTRSGSSAGGIRAVGPGPEPARRDLAGGRRPRGGRGAPRVVVRVVGRGRGETDDVRLAEVGDHVARLDRRQPTRWRSAGGPRAARHVGPGRAG